MVRRTIVAILQPLAAATENEAEEHPHHGVLGPLFHLRRRFWGLQHRSALSQSTCMTGAAAAARLRKEALLQEDCGGRLAAA